MRTTLDIDDDVLQAAKELAHSRRTYRWQGALGAGPPGARAPPYPVPAQRRACPGPSAQGKRQAHDGARQPPARRGVSGPALLDVNLLVALFDPDHVHHEPAHALVRDPPFQRLGHLSSDRERRGAHPLEPRVLPFRRDPGADRTPSRVLPGERPSRLLAGRPFALRLSDLQPRDRTSAAHGRLPSGARDEARRPARHIRQVDPAEGCPRSAP